VLAAVYEAAKEVFF